jgi:hypothetical protein
MQRFGSDGSNSGRGQCALEEALLTLLRHHAAGDVQLLADETPEPY